MLRFCYLRSRDMSRIRGREHNLNCEIAIATCHCCCHREAASLASQGAALKSPQIDARSDRMVLENERNTRSSKAQGNGGPTLGHIRRGRRGARTTIAVTINRLSYSDSL